MIGKDFKTGIICNVVTSLHILILYSSNWGIHSGFKEAIMTMVIVGFNESRNWEPILHYQLDVLIGGF